MGSRYVVAEGTDGHGLTWVIWARRPGPGVTVQDAAVGPLRHHKPTAHLASRRAA